MLYLGATLRMSQIYASFDQSRLELETLPPMSDLKALLLIKLSEMADVHKKLRVFAESLHAKIGNDAVQQHPTPKEEILINPNEWGNLQILRPHGGNDTQSAFVWYNPLTWIQTIPIPSNICPDMNVRTNPRELLLYLGALERMKAIASKFFQTRDILSQFNDYGNGDAYYHLQKLNEYRETYDELYIFALVQIDFTFPGINNPYPMPVTEVRLTPIESAALDQFEEEMHSQHTRRMEELFESNEDGG